MVFIGIAEFAVMVEVVQELVCVADVVLFQQVCRIHQTNASGNVTETDRELSRGLLTSSLRMVSYAISGRSSWSPGLMSLSLSLMPAIKTKKSGLEMMSACWSVSAISFMLAPWGMVTILVELSLLMPSRSLP